MQLITVTFERVFDIRRERRGGRITRPVTEFSFETTDKDCPLAVMVPGWPELVSGMTVTTLLRNQGDWRSLAGWVNLRTGEIAARSYGRELVFGLAFCCLSVASWFLVYGAGAAGSISANRIGAQCLVWVFALLGIVELVLAFRFYRDRRLLKKVVLSSGVQK
ncbi:hypothetical protein [Uliginosibacterium sp. TH139]|uniref:hypothetical protein n=1 Tax=Uliginosibacterium sp. TH139 TaxID=2067453 RepID=UPI000C7E39A0|nr:hypothetical protein [Uliginosibacterium sp. TH139]PLK49171.1 hypothetical protein C0V76_08200 [Uliginosibacterium sp. TH139]